MLSDTQVKRAKAKNKTYLLRDADGLYLKVDTAGRKYWLLRYWENGKGKQISLGVYPKVNLFETRKNAMNFKISTKIAN